MTSAALPTPAIAIDLESRVEWIDTDAAGHHHNSAVMRWVEAAEAEMMRRAELPDYFSEAPRVHQSVDFRAPMMFGQRVRTQLWIEHIGTTSLSFGFEVTVAKTTEPADAWTTAATGRLITAHVVPGVGGSSPWPDTWKRALLRYCADDSASTNRSTPESTPR